MQGEQEARHKCISEHHVSQAGHRNGVHRDAQDFPPTMFVAEATLFDSSQDLLVHCTNLNTEVLGRSADKPQLKRCDRSKNGQVMTKVDSGSIGS